MKFIYTASILLFLAACSSAPVKNPTVTEPPQVVATPNHARGHIGFICDADCTPEEVKRLAAAEKLSNEMVHSECFEKFWLKVKLDPGQTKGVPNAKLLEQLREANVTVPVHYYYTWKNVVGARDPGKPDLWFNRKYHNGFNECNTVSNALHEWTHSALEWEHHYYSRDRDAAPGLSGPYAINDGADKCCFKDKILSP